MKVIKTHVPSTGPSGVVPIPDVFADVIGETGNAHGKSSVGNTVLSSV
jgi:hypothetical protein